MYIRPLKNHSKHRILRLICGFWLGLLLISCAPAALHDAVNNPSTNQARSSCIQDFDPQQDYFPDKTRITDSIGFQVEYHNSYKVVTIKSPWRDAQAQFRYVLVHCGAPIPTDVPSQQIIEIPIQRIAILSTTHLSHLEKLNLLERIVAVNQLDWIYGEATQKKLAEQNVASVGNNSTINIEQILDIAPDLITTYGTGDVNRDAHPKLLEAGLKVAINAEYMESTPLGQAEWIKFTSLFFNAEAAANTAFDDIKQQYQQIVKIAQTATVRPTVLTGFNNNGTWYISGGRSYVAQLLNDAGATYPWAENQQAGSIPMSFEAVYDRAENADFWLNASSQWKTMSDVRQADDRYKNFKAVQNDRIFNNTARVNAAGGNDFWQSGIVNPQIVLSDVVKILHPELLPNHKLFYYQPLQSDQPSASTDEPSSS